MSNRPWRVLMVTASLIAAVSSAVLCATEQTQTAEPQKLDLPRLSDGQPDVQGYWRYIRPADSIEFYTLEGVTETYPGSGEPIIAAGVPRPGPLRSVVIDPPDGRIPYQPSALKRRDQTRVARLNPTNPADVDGRALCFLAGVPRQTYEAMDGGLHQIVQTPGYVLMLWEWAHSYRIIPVDERPHIGPKLTLWQGDSRGHWEGNTLIVNTVNQQGKSLDMLGDFHGDELRVVERFRVVDADTIRYEATLDDPVVYTRPWTMALTLTRDRTPGLEILEFACQEGNRVDLPGLDDVK